MKFDKRVVESGYVIAIINNDDSLPYMGKNDPCLYLSDATNEKWGDFYSAKIFPNEASLAQKLERVNLDTDDDVHPMPIFWETTITSVDSESFGEHIRQTKIAKALAKLNEEDMVLLGLMGENE